MIWKCIKINNFDKMNNDKASRKSVDNEPNIGSKQEDN